MRMIGTAAQSSCLLDHAAGEDNGVPAERVELAPDCG
jgi:hypothetical protein